MNRSFIDGFLKWFFIISSIVYLLNSITLFLQELPFFESFLSFLIEAVAAFYFIKKDNLIWVRENVFFLLATMTGLMMTKSFFFYYHELDYQISAIISVLLLGSSFISFKQYLRNNWKKICKTFLFSCIMAHS